MNKQLVPAVKGTRDFYPEEMAFRNWLYGKVKKVSEKFGYQEFDGPYIEYLDLYADKTSEEILKDQAFSLKDRDNRDILLRPEITPTFARMVAQRSGQLIKPIRWFSFGRAYRYEQPQKGRTREFFQWEINILGPETPEADAEIIAIAVEYFRELGLTSEEVAIRISDRSLFEIFCQENNISEENRLPLIRFMDRIDKIPDGELSAEWDKQVGLPLELIDKVKGYINNQDYSNSPWLMKVFQNLEKYPGAREYTEFDPRIFRGFDYYTRTVFEAWDKTGGLRRALFGGGRFDNLTETMGGEKVPGVGMAPGDVPIQVILEQFGKMPDLAPTTAKVLVTIFSAELAEISLEISSRLRSNNINTELWVEPESKLEKQLKYADSKGIPYVVIIGPDEASQGKVVLKNLASKEQNILSIDDLISSF